jgi:hypothetical protein
VSDGFVCTTPSLGKPQKTKPNQTKPMGGRRAECSSFKLMVPHLFGGMFVNIPGVTVIPRVHSLFWGTSWNISYFN